MKIGFFIKRFQITCFHGTFIIQNILKYLFRTKHRSVWRFFLQKFYKNSTEIAEYAFFCKFGSNRIFFRNETNLFPSIPASRGRKFRGIKNLAALFIALADIPLAGHYPPAVKLSRKIFAGNLTTILSYFHNFSKATGNTVPIIHSPFAPVLSLTDKPRERCWNKIKRDLHSLVKLDFSQSRIFSLNL